MLRKMLSLLSLLLLLQTVAVFPPYATTDYSQPGRGMAFLRSFPCFNLGRAEAAELAFDELYSTMSSRGVTLSDKLQENAGQTVSMVGFMAPPLTPTINFFVLTSEPMSICPFCGSDADWPTDIVVVKLQEAVTALPFDSPIRVTGTLELGSQVDAETGFVSLVRIQADKLEAVE